MKQLTVPQSQTHNMHTYIHCVRKKGPTCFFNIFYKIRAILVKFGTPFPE